MHFHKHLADNIKEDLMEKIRSWEQENYPRGAAQGRPQAPDRKHHFRRKGAGKAHPKTQLFWPRSTRSGDRPPTARRCRSTALATESQHDPT